jgi:hypothetical protein
VAVAVAVLGNGASQASASSRREACRLVPPSWRPVSRVAVTSPRRVIVLESFMVVVGWLFAPKDGRADGDGVGARSVCQRLVT